MFSWNSGSIKVASALDLVLIMLIMLIMMIRTRTVMMTMIMTTTMTTNLISGSETRSGSMAGTWGMSPLRRVRDMVRKRVQGQTSVSDIRSVVGWSSLRKVSIIRVIMKMMIMFMMKIMTILILMVMTIPREGLNHMNV